MEQEQPLTLPSSKDAEAYSEEFDNIAGATLHELVEAQTHLRTELIMQDRDEGLSSPVRLGATLYVAHAVDADPEIAKYDDPTDEELQQVLDRAASYDGDWYHSRVTLNYTGSWSPLQEQIAELDEESGVFIVFNYETSEELSNRFRELMESER